MMPRVRTRLVPTQGRDRKRSELADSPARPAHPRSQKQKPFLCFYRHWKTSRCSGPPAGELPVASGRCPCACLTILMMILMFNKNRMVQEYWVGVLCK